MSTDLIAILEGFCIALPVLGIWFFLGHLGLLMMAEIYARYGDVFEELTFDYDSLNIIKYVLGPLLVVIAIGIYFLGRARQGVEYLLMKLEKYLNKIPVKKEKPKEWD